MWWGVIMVVVVMGTSGCAGKKSSLLLERLARGPLREAPFVAKSLVRHLEPTVATQTQGGVEVSIQHATADYLKGFFDDKAVFGAFGGNNPFFPEHLVFYVKITNASNQKIGIIPGEFACVDDQGNQYHPIGVDYVTAFAESRAPFSTATRGVIEDARPGYFGISLPVGKMLVPKSQWRFALIQQSGLQRGYLFPGVVYDGLVAFWSPTTHATTLRLLITNIKTGFDATDTPSTTLEFAFDFGVTH